jgi:hypothetical protein
LPEFVTLPECVFRAMFAAYVAGGDTSIERVAKTAFLQHMIPALPAPGQGNALLDHIATQIGAGMLAASTASVAVRRVGAAHAGQVSS